MGRAPKDHTPVMDEVFGMFEYHIFEKLEIVDNMLAIISGDAKIERVPDGFRENYMREKIMDMIDQIAEKREASFRGNRKLESGATK